MVHVLNYLIKNNKGANQNARTCRLILAFVVLIVIQEVFSRQGSYCLSNALISQILLNGGSLNYISAIFFRSIEHDFVFV